MGKGEKIKALKLKIGDVIIYKGFNDTNLLNFTKGNSYTVRGFYDGRYGVSILNDLGMEAHLSNDNIENFFTQNYVEDNVNHPKHYTSHPSGIECIEITRHYCFSVGNAIKYLWRAGLKKDASLEDKQKEIEDLNKAIWYINDRIKQLKDDKA